MADNSRPLSNLVHQDVLSNGDSFVSVLANGAVRQSLVDQAHSNSTLKIGKLVLANNANTPATSGIAVTPGEVWTDGTYLYVATGSTTVKRIALSSF